MPWRPDAPDGSRSVKANESILQDNTLYIQTTMGNTAANTTNTNVIRDHFWNVGSNEDGRHRFINSPAFTINNAVADPVIGSGMDGVFYLKTINNRAEWFHQNTSNIYQVTPGYKTGSVVVPSSGSYSIVVAVPQGVYGEIFMFTTALGKASAVTGFFRSNTGGGSKVEAWALTNHQDGSSSAVAALKFANGSEAVGLNILARADDASSGLTWNYRITYRAI